MNFSGIITSIAPVPEPTSMILFTGGFAMLAKGPGES